jgi:hypothetical protein
MSNRRVPVSSLSRIRCTRRRTCCGSLPTTIRDSSPPMRYCTQRPTARNARRSWPITTSGFCRRSTSWDNSSPCATDGSAQCRGPKWTNRLFAVSGTALGRVKLPAGIFHLNLHRYDQQTIFDRLKAAGKIGASISATFRSACSLLPSAACRWPGTTPA